MTRRSLAAAVQSGLAGLLTCGLMMAAAPARLPPFAPESPVAPPGTRAAWVWSLADAGTGARGGAGAGAQAGGGAGAGGGAEAGAGAGAGTAAGAEAMVAWARAHGVRALFVHVVRDARTNGDAAGLLHLRGLCDKAGIRLDALGGEPDWALDPAKALAWRDTVLALGVFHGLHVDVEPYLLPEWSTRRDQAAAGLLDVLDALRGGDLPLEADVPFWYHTVPVGGATLADEVIARVDALTVMSYRTTATGPNSIMDVATDLLNRAGRAALPVRLAVETQALADCAHCGFARRADLDAVLRDVDAAAGRFGAFEGVAVHQYSTWSAMPE